MAPPPLGNGVEIGLPPPVGGGLGWGPCGRTSTHLWPELELTAPSDGRCWTRRPPPCPPPTGRGASLFFLLTSEPPRPDVRTPSTASPARGSATRGAGPRRTGPSP